MKGKFLLPLVAVASVLTANALTVRSPIADGRVWQTVLAPSEPLQWPWLDAADSAKLVITNHAAGTVDEVIVERAENEQYGAYALNVPAAPEEKLYSVALFQYADETRLSADWARLAYIPGVPGGNGATVRAAAPAADWKKSEPVAVFAYASVWTNATADAGTVAVAWINKGVSVSRPLEGTSGYDALPLPRGVDALLTLSFDGNDVWGGTVCFGFPGFMLSIR